MSDHFNNIFTINDSIFNKIIQAKIYLIEIDYHIQASMMTVTDSEISLTDERRQKAVEEFVRRATQEYGDRIRGVILYGSVARGTAVEDSDIDLLVVIDEEDFRLRRELVGLSFDILLETGGDLSVKVLSNRDFQTHKSHSFLRNVLAEGAKLA
jgi:predicted nucleotidyltransferase